MKIVAIETSTEACSVALNLDGEIHRCDEYAARTHTERVLPMLHALLEQTGTRLTDMDALAFGRGPGSFTGVRIATATAQGLALGAGLPVVPVSTLAALAQRAIDERSAESVLAAIDARMEEVYWGVFGRDEQGLAALRGQEVVVPPDKIEPPPALTGAVVAAGSGWQRYAAALEQRLAGVSLVTAAALLPDAASVSRLAAHELAAGHVVDPDQALPVYLRDRVTHQRH